MNTANIKKYAPQARNAFITAVTKRANELGIYASHIEEAIEEGQVLSVEGRSVDLQLKGARNKLIAQVESTGFTVLMEHIAYTWFNRLCAIRYMELHDYLDHGLRVLSHPDDDDNNSFEILEHAQDVAEDLGLNRDQIIELKLAGNQDELLYRTLLLGQCHALHKAMPFLFEAIDDETELLLPDNLTRTDSVLRGLVNDIPAEDWEQVEVIGWLYQFYISEKKDEVIGTVVKSEDIPAATQLFTPNWIVKYLVQNSVGRQWLQTYPDSSIKAGMEYYIEPAEQTDEVNSQIKAITPASIEPESIKVLDPACGSGHILVEAYQVLKAIYEERGYRNRDIPQLILENNLFGLDIDDRAAQLAGFALMMLACADDKRIFSRDVQLNVMAIQEAGKELSVEGIALSSEEQETALLALLDLFANAKTFGSLIQVPDALAKKLPELHQIIEDQIDSPDIFSQHTAKVLLPLIKQAEILARKYDAVVANPPYMGSNYFCSDLKIFINKNYKSAKQNLYSAFIIASLRKSKVNGIAHLITMAGWLYLSTFKAIRGEIINGAEISNIRVLGNDVFGSSVGSIVNAATCCIFNRVELNDKTIVYGKDGCIQSTFSKKQVLAMPNLVFPINIAQKHVDLIASEAPLSNFAEVAQGLSTANDNKYIRYWFEVNINKFSVKGGSKWFPINKGGECRKWYGNNIFVVDWEHSGKAISQDKKAYIRNPDKYLIPAITWGRVTGGTPSFRYYPEGFILSDIGCGVFPKNNFELILSILNTAPAKKVFDFMSENYKIEVGHVKSMPIKNINFNKELVNEIIKIYKGDWDQSTISWDFEGYEFRQGAKEFFNKNHQKALGIYRRALKIEQEINKVISSGYGWEAEVTGFSSLPTLSYYKELDYNFFCANDLTQFIEFFVGCSVGRYSLDQKGLVYAHTGNEGFTELVEQSTYKTFPADDDGIIPLTDQEWFADDATHRFREFIRAVWGEDNLQINLDFVAESLCLYAIKPKSSESRLETIRRYLSTQFYKDHLKTYKKRPIYWLFSSGKQKAFECLVYLHRYNESTLSRMRTEYVTPLLGKYEASTMVLEKQMQDASTTAESNRFKKSLTALEKKQTELSAFDDKLKHYADMRISLDLDDGVKVNYGKFGGLLAEVKAVTGKK